MNDEKIEVVTQPFDCDLLKDHFFAQVHSSIELPDDEKPLCDEDPRLFGFDLIL